MSLSLLIPRWCPQARGHHLNIVTDQACLNLSQSLLENARDHIKGGQVINLDQTPLTSLDQIPCASENDLLVINVSVDTFMAGANKLFPSFRSPQGWSAYSMMIRPGIDQTSFAAGLETSLSEIRYLESRLHTFAENKQLRITNPSGTDLLVRTREFKSLPYQCTSKNRHAYFPPAEIYTPLWENFSEGMIAVDLTVGELRYEGRLLHTFGLVEEPLIIKVFAGQIQTFSGHPFAKILTKEFSSWDENSKHVVELGFGLSSLLPTGLIGVDESILNTCHFGIGDNRFYGGTMVAPLHWDVVINKPMWKDV